MAQYESKIIYEYAAKLTEQIKSTIICNFFIGVLGGVIIFGGISAYFQLGYDFLLMAIGALVGAIFGISMGKNKAQDMKIRAQLALCQAKIEENTRR